MISYLRKIKKTRKFGEIEDYPLIMSLLNNIYTSRLIRNFYNFLEIDIPETFIKLISNNKIHKELC